MLRLRKTAVFLLLSLIFVPLIVLLCRYGSPIKVDAVPADRDAVCVPIIMYHQVKDFKLGKDVISPYELESDLKYLKENRYETITMTQLIDYAENGGSLPKKPIILSFDDGYLSTYVNVLPLLKKYDVKIVFSVIGVNMDDFTRVPDDSIDYSHVTWEQLNETIDTGYVEVQNHSYDLHRTGKGRTGCTQMAGESLQRYREVLISDIGGFQDQLTRMTGCTPNTFAYPYGRSSKNTDPILKELGFKATLTCKYGVNVISKGSDLYGLKRICRSHGNSLKKVLQDGLDTLKYS